MVNEINDLLDNAASKCGFTREKFSQRAVPTEFQKIHVIVSYGEFDHIFVFNNLILPSLRSKTQYKDKYIVFVTWSGFSNLISNVDEVWSLKNQEMNEKLYEKAEGHKNYSDAHTIIIRNLNEYFRNVTKVEKFENMFNHGHNFSFHKEDMNITISKNQSGNINYLNKSVLEEINKLDESRRYFIIPFKYVRILVNGRINYYKITSNFWQNIVGRMTKKGFPIVLLKNCFTHDLSSHFVDCKEICMIHENNWNNVIGYMKQTNMFIDFFGGLSCFAQYGDCPNITLIDRSFYHQMNLHQIEDVISANKDINKKHYSFFQFFVDDAEQNFIYVDQLMRVLKKTEIKPLNNILNYSINLNDYLNEKTKKYNLRFVGYKKINEGVI